MTWIALLLIVIAGIAEHFKDLSEEGKLKGYWDKHYIGWYHDGAKCFLPIRSFPSDTEPLKALRHQEEAYFWKVGWLQSDFWEYIPIWIRQYLSFRDGWHLLKFISLNSFAVAVVLLAELSWWWYLAIRFAFSFPETALRWYETRN